tara:strand:- start:191 stop:967 length:777 start_codon:yes stop_codon:yes gene_type:complete
MLLINNYMTRSDGCCKNVSVQYPSNYPNDNNDGNPFRKKLFIDEEIENLNSFREKIPAIGSDLRNQISKYDTGPWRISNGGSGLSNGTIYQSTNNPICLENVSNWNPSGAEEGSTLSSDVVDIDIKCMDDLYNNCNWEEYEKARTDVVPIYGAGRDNMKRHFLEHGFREPETIGNCALPTTPPPAPDPPAPPDTPSSSNPTPTTAPLSFIDALISFDFDELWNNHKIPFISMIVGLFLLFVILVIIELNFGITKKTTK